MKFSVWVITREPETWLTAGEILVLGVVMFAPAGAALRLLCGLPLLVHVGYKALTGLPIGSIPGRPEGGNARSNYDLRIRVVRFLEEVRRVEDYAHQADLAGLPEREVQAQLLDSQRRLMTAAKEVAKECGQRTIRA